MTNICHFAYSGAFILGLPLAIYEMHQGL